ncbi:ribonuclease E activity regulator RraA [Neisseriaceae bacterium JH1-16]|nr:ribonuclease E activity regulator RraA [Neisseriaceae bacterium JH1-16]
MIFLTTDLCDDNDDVRVLEPLFRDFGDASRFSGRVVTLKLYEDNSLIRETLTETGSGRVLVVDGGGSTRCALLGDQLAELGVANGWAGVVIYGCVRDTAVLGNLPLGVKALASHPKKSTKRGEGQRDIPVSFAGVTFQPGDWLYADEDGIIVSGRSLL